MKKQSSIFGLCVIIFLFVLIPSASLLIAEPKEHATKIETFLSKVDTLIINESVDLGMVEGTYGANVEIKAIASYEPAIGSQKVSGFHITVLGGGRNEQRKTVYVDMDEIENVSKALEYMISLSEKWKAVRRINTEVAFTTKDSFRVGFSQNGYAWKGFASGSGDVEAVCNFNSLENLKTLKSLIDTGLEWLKGSEGR
ncbi:MAG: hypothetical protein E3K37_06415 [Candidatus Kuenenia sp.]|nr:hypothetical protein [Candidatus Kuenenia hertensis]